MPYSSALISFCIFSHQACRRQAPAWLVASLLKAVPSSIQAATQFGELPLHLAVEMGAAPEVVNLLLVNYFPSIHVQDNSGRTPMQINLEADFFHIEDHKYIHESLRNADRTLVALEGQWQAKLDAQAVQHEAQLRQLEATHDAAMQIEKENQSNLRKQLARVDGHLQQYKEERKSLERTLSSHHVEKDTWLQIMESKEDTVEDLIKRIEDKEKDMTNLKGELQVKSDECLGLIERVEMLEDDLRNITLLHHDEVAVSMRRLEDDFQRILKSQAVLGGKLHGQSQGLALLLEERGIALPPPPPPPSPVLERDLHQDDTAMGEVSAAAAQAARAAIAQAEVEVYEKNVLSEMEREIHQQESTMEHANSPEEKKDSEEM